LCRVSPRQFAGAIAPGLAAALVAALVAAAIATSIEPGHFAPPLELILLGAPAAASAALVLILLDPRLRALAGGVLRFILRPQASGLTGSFARGRLGR
jgi:hypothetical protein